MEVHTFDSRVSLRFAATRKNEACRLHLREMFGGFEAQADVCTDDHNHFASEIRLHHGRDLLVLVAKDRMHRFLHGVGVESADRWPEGYDPERVRALSSRNGTLLYLFISS